MPATLTYPGVYIEEIPSGGVHTITGVSTAVTVFVGSAKRGSIDKAISILSFSDYERRFGGLETDSEMGYAVRQFFLTAAVTHGLYGWRREHSLLHERFKTVRPSTCSKSLHWK